MGKNEILEYSVVLSKRDIKLNNVNIREGWEGGRDTFYDFFSLACLGIQDNPNYKILSDMKKKFRLYLTLQVCSFH